MEKNRIKPKGKRSMHTRLFGNNNSITDRVSRLAPTILNSKLFKVLDPLVSLQEGNIGVYTKYGNKISDSLGTPDELTSAIIGLKTMIVYSINVANIFGTTPFNLHVDNNQLTKCIHPLDSRYRGMSTSPGYALYIDLGIYNLEDLVKHEKYFFDQPDIQDKSIGTIELWINILDASLRSIMNYSAGYDLGYRVSRIFSPVSEYVGLHPSRMIPLNEILFLAKHSPSLTDGKNLIIPTDLFFEYIQKVKSNVESIIADGFQHIPLYSRILNTLNYILENKRNALELIASKKPGKGVEPF